MRRRCAVPGGCQSGLVGSSGRWWLCTWRSTMRSRYAADTCRSGRGDGRTCCQWGACHCSCNSQRTACLRRWRKAGSPTASAGTAIWRQCVCRSQTRRRCAAPGSCRCGLAGDSGRWWQRAWRSTTSCRYAADTSRSGRGGGYARGQRGACRCCCGSQRTGCSRRRRKAGSRTRSTVS